MGQTANPSSLYSHFGTFARVPCPPDSKGDAGRHLVGTTPAEWRSNSGPFRPKSGFGHQIEDNSPYIVFDSPSPGQATSSNQIQRR